MAVIRWQVPAQGSEIDRLQEEVNKLFQSFLPGAEPFYSRVYPALNLTEDADNFYVRAEIPGVRPEDLEVSVVEGRLLIRGQRKPVQESPESNYHRKERESGFFRRTLSLPARVDSGKVAAAIKNGVLTLTLPKAEEAKPRKITVKSE